MIGLRTRDAFAVIMTPLVRGLVRMQVPPVAVTALSVLLAALAGLVLSHGHFAVGGWLYLMSGMCDFLDGRLARATHQASAAGAALDSILDRYGEAAVLLGLAWWFPGSWAVLFIVLAITGSLLVSYVRAPGEALGARFPNIGEMQRPERLVLLALVLILAPLFDDMLPVGSHGVLLGAVVVLAVSTHLTALQRMVYLVRALRGGSDRAMPLAGWTARAALCVMFDATVTLGLAMWTGAGLAAMSRAGMLACIVLLSLIERASTSGSGASAPMRAGRWLLLTATSLAAAAGLVALLLHADFSEPWSWAISHVGVLAAWTLPMLRVPDAPQAAQQQEKAASRLQGALGALSGAFRAHVAQPRPPRRMSSLSRGVSKT